MQQRIVTLTTDFGLHDHYVGAMKGVILNVNPEVRLVDICHSLCNPSTCSMAPSPSPRRIATFLPTPSTSWWWIREWAASRRPILVTAEKHMFIAPDNGVLSMVYEREERIRSGTSPPNIISCSR